jgi:hypothetical protein
MAKDIIAGGSPLCLPAFRVMDTFGKWHEVQPSTVVSFDTVDVETYEDGLRPDLIGSVSTSLGDELITRRLIIEIRVTHAVESRKLDMLRARGESVLEIDLSKVDRGLDEVGLTQLLLDDAPRDWLFHRDEERRRDEVSRKAANEVRRREDRKTWAIAAEARRKEAREAARLSPPAGSVSPQVQAWAESQRRNWQMIGCGVLFDVPADDGIFDVASGIWRARALHFLAPWGENASQPGFRPDLPRISQTIGKDMRTRGWVKTVFAGKLTRFTTRKVDWDPVGDAIEEYITQGLSSLGYVDQFQTKQVNLGYAYSENKRGWESFNRLIDQMLSLITGVRGKGIEITIGGREITSRVELVEALDSIDRLDIAALDSSLPKRIAHTVYKGTREPRDLDPHGDLESQGIEIHLRGDGGKGSTARALAHIKAEHQRAWREDTGIYVDDTAFDLLSVFLGFAGQIDGFEETMKEEGAGDLLIEEAIRSRICVDVDTIVRDPVAAACKKVREAAMPLRKLADEIKAVIALAAQIKDGVLGAWFTEEALRHSLRAAAGEMSSDGFSREHVRRNAAEWIAELEHFSDRWKYGADFAQRALESTPPGENLRLVDAVLERKAVIVRKALAGIRGRRDRPDWVSPSLDALLTEKPGK